MPDVPSPSPSGLTVYLLKFDKITMFLQSILGGKPVTFVYLDDFMSTPSGLQPFSDLMTSLTGSEKKMIPIAFLDGKFLGGVKEIHEYTMQ
jgi:hypothetical protein